MGDSAIFPHLDLGGELLAAVKKFLLSAQGLKIGSIPSAKLRTILNVSFPQDPVANSGTCFHGAVGPSNFRMA